MRTTIFSGKKSQIASRKIVFYIIAAIIISIAFLLLVYVIPSRKSEIALIPLTLENYLLTQRFFNSPSCFAFQDEKTSRAYPWIIDLEKFSQDNLNKCYDANNKDVKAYRLTLGYSKIPTEPVTHPIPDDFSSTCKNICNKQGKKCILGVDDGGTSKVCDNSFGFEGNDDYCLCGESDNIIPSPTSDFQNTCTYICGAKGCIYGVDDINRFEVCGNPFGFEKNQIDDYCVCGASETIIPSPSANDLYDTCKNICGAKGCITGIDDVNRFEVCGNPFGFEKNQNDDYCICGKSESIVPNRDDFDSTCDSICKDKGKKCSSGIDDSSITVKCDAEFRFEGYDDYCICEDDSIEEKIIVNTKNWQGILKKAETFDVFIYDAGAINKAKLKIEVQDAE